MKMVIWWFRSRSGTVQVFAATGHDVVTCRRRPRGRSQQSFGGSKGGRDPTEGDVTEPNYGISLDVTMYISLYPPSNEYRCGIYPP